MGKPLALNHWTNQESHYTAPRIQFGGYSAWSQVTDCFHPSAWTLPTLSMAEHTCSNSSIFSSTEGRAAVSRQHTTFNLIHTRTQQTNQQGTGFQSSALLCSTEIIGAILRQTSLKGRRCQINTALQLGPPKKPHLGYKKASTFTCFMIGFFPLCSHQFIRLKHCTHASSKMTLKVWSWLRILGPYKPNVWLCYRGTVIILDAEYWGIGKT